MQTENREWVICAGFNVVGLFCMKYQTLKNSFYEGFVLAVNIYSVSVCKHFATTESFQKSERWGLSMD